MSSGIRISELSIAEVLGNLRERKWQVPKFQREFVWDTSAVCGLATSVIDGYPIGMVTLWEQPSDSSLGLGPISIDDWDSQNKSKIIREFGIDDANPSQVMAILDGRQRCTSLAMAFGGLSPQFGKNKYAGRYFLNASLKDPLERVIFKKKSEVEREGLTNLPACIAKGYFPLAPFESGQSILQQWYGYIQKLKDSSIYPAGEFPDEAEILRRDNILQQAFEGITETKLGACIVPQKYDLGQICEIFETLNLTGMKVSTVDLINSWLLRDTDDGFHLREWLDDLAQLDGAVGWSVPRKRPELIAQFATACYVTETDAETKAKPRRVSGKSTTRHLTSIKSADLLATPTEHWLSIARRTDQFAEFIGDFQKVVAGGTFGYLQCPYPASASIYVGLRWHKAFDPEDAHRGWKVEDLNRLYKAFFWRNSLGQRYDQGFLSQIGTDIKTLKEVLARKHSFADDTEWAGYADAALDELFKETVLPDKDRLISWLTDGRNGGALQNALLLPMIAAAESDFLGNALIGDDESRVELHHIYPNRWCRENASGKLREYLLKDGDGKNYVDSVSNLMPISRRLNLEWRAKSPSTFIIDRAIQYTGPVAEALAGQFIDDEGFRMLKAGTDAIPEFWERRASIIADDLILKMSI